jgi:hypothetical protein
LKVNEIVTEAKKSYYECLEGALAEVPPNEYHLAETLMLTGLARAVNELIDEHNEKWQTK